MKILFLLYFDIDSSAQVGVAKKINYQISAMQKLGNEVVLGFCSNNKLILRLNNETILEIQAMEGTTHYRRALVKILPKVAQDYDMIYVRFPGSVDYYFYKTIKLLDGKVSTILEMPTYPIGGELVGYLKKLKEEKRYIQLLERLIVYSIHKIFSRRLKKHLKHIVSFSDFNEIWGVPVINIENGIDCEAITKRNYQASTKNEVRLIFVAVFSKWHGIDRLINGIDVYYKRKERHTDVKLTLIGSSDEIDNIINSEEFSRVKEHVRILGAKYGSELDREYDQADIAVSSLGMHRIGLKYGSTLKTREYCAKGIPFIYGYIEKGINSDCKYALRIPADESPVDIEAVISFFKNIQNYPYEKELQEFAKKYDWKVQMAKVFSKLIEIEGIDQ